MTEVNNEGQGNQSSGQQNQGDNSQNGNQGNQDKGQQNNDSLLDLNKDAGKDAGKYVPGTKPDGLDDSLWDPDAKTFKGDALYEKLTAAEKQAKDLREKMGRRGAPPEKADDYKVEVPDDAPWKENFKTDDPVFKQAKEIAHKYGLSQGQFGPFVKEFLDVAFKSIAEGGEGGQQAEPTAEEIAAAREAEITKIGPNGPAVVRAVSEFVRQNIGVHFDDKAVETIKAMTSTAEGIHLLNQIREMVGSGERIPMGNIDGQAVTGLPSDAEIMQYMGTPEYQKGDATALQKVEKWMDMRQKAGRPIYLQA